MDLITFCRISKEIESHADFMLNLDMLKNIICL